MNHMNRAAVLKKIQPVLGNYRPENYRTFRMWATSHDGVKVPLSVIQRKDIGPGPTPTLLDGYGAYEIT